MGASHFSGPVVSDNGFEGTISGITDETQLTDNSGGTASDTIAAISASPTQAEIANAIASLAAKVNALIADLT